MLDQRRTAVNLGHAWIQKILSSKEKYFTEGHRDFPGEAKGPSASVGRSLSDLGNL